MRMHRSVIAVLAFCLIGLVPLATSSSATAAEPAARASAATVASQQLAKPARTVKFEFKQTTSRTYKFFGKVQAAKNKKILLMHTPKRKKGKYSIFKTGRTNSRGNYSWKGLRATGYFYVKVPSDARFATSYSQLIHVYYN